MVETKTIIIYPHLGDKAGTGHLKRLLPFFYDSRFNTYLLHRDPDYVLGILDDFGIKKERFITFSDIKNIDDKIDMIILDNRESDRYLYDKLKDIAPIVALDEGGDSRDYVPYTIDMLPNLKDSKPNYFNPGLLDLPPKKREVKELKKVLITFGGQDPFDLTTKTVEVLKDQYDITTVIGPLFKKEDFGVNKLQNIQSLKEILSDYDLVITSFGITAYEAVSAGIPVALFNPTEYHQKLSLKAGFITLDEKLKINFNKAKKSLKKIEIGEKELLTDYIFNLFPSNMGCPLCKRKTSTSDNRYINKTYFTCSHCGISYMNTHKNDKKYDKDYFFEDYKKQYGKTYLEDFKHIKNMGVNRLKFIKRKTKSNDTLLDIGCAFGPFLQAAKDDSYSVYGVDVSREAIDYVSNELKIPSQVSGFPISEALDFPTPFNVITMWYVIEHFKELDRVLNQVNLLLEKGGVFAFSTPNQTGISGRKNIDEFNKKSPDDHFTIWNPKSAKKVLKDYGFKVYKIRVTGHHPVRFGKLVKGKVITKIILLISKIFNLGDTFEVYAVKEKNI